MLAGNSLQFGPGEEASGGGRGWNTAVAAATAAAALAILVYAFPGDWSALWRGANVMGEPLQDNAAMAEQDLSAKLYADLERHLRWQPSDVRAQVFKARLDMEARRFEKAAAAYEKAVAGDSKAALDPGVWVEYAEARGMVQGGTLAGEPLKLVLKALSLDADHPQALDLAGSVAWEVQDFAGAVAHWNRLLKQIPAGTARHAELSAAIERAQQRARISLPLNGGSRP